LRSGVQAKITLCEQCEGEGSIPVDDGIVSICDACGGRIGILSTFKRGRGAEMMSTQFHLRAASWAGWQTARYLRQRTQIELGIDLGGGKRLMPRYTQPEPDLRLSRPKDFSWNFSTYTWQNMAVDIRRMGKAELDELNRSAREWRERNKPAQAVTDAIPEQSQADFADPRETKTPPSTVGEQIELLWDWVPTMDQGLGSNGT
jgi:hypothetical protein